MKHEFTPEQMRRIQNLVGRIVERSQAFKIFPPKEVTDDPGVLRSADASTRLADTKWWLRFSEHDEQLLTFAELMVLTYNLVMIKLQFAQAQRSQPGKIKIALHFAVEQIMTAEGVTTLLSKLQLEGIEPQPEAPAEHGAIPNVHSEESSPVPQPKGQQVHWPVYGIHEGGPDEPFQTLVDEIADPEIPGKNLHVIILFTDLAEAQRYVKLRGRGVPVPVAKSHEELKAFLKSGGAEVVQFDPRIEGNRIEFNRMVFVKSILAM